jgi:hypothetical protein
MAASKEPTGCHLAPSNVFDFDCDLRAAERITIGRTALEIQLAQEIAGEAVDRPALLVGPIERHREAAFAQTGQRCATCAGVTRSSLSTH